MQQITFNPGNFYHIFNRGNNKESIFKEPKNYLYFLSLVDKHLSPICNLYAYCLLPNHFHILLQIKDFNELPIEIQNSNRKLSQPFSNLFNAYSKAINKAHNRTGSLFQEHLHRIKIESDAYFRELILYIHLNPIKHGISNDFINYPHSSYQKFLKNEVPPTIHQFVIEHFNDIKNFEWVHFQKKYKIELLKAIVDIDC